ncbi:MAG: tRNA pseudouridine(55) synthase TruB [Gloeomargaritaceae cyanobacterium C42_A2020_066]|nr:tRNA pseudouridine(55) synthase TruB [Gloeomargaritaceae cyanobacterium C42_A2020_066]
MLGFLNLHKPAGRSSHDAVAQVRRLLHLKRVGHGGTLDPTATGVLPIALGSATRLLDYLPGAKAYRGTVRFGMQTTTDDLEGEVLNQVAADYLTLGQVTACLPHFLGTQRQRPPAFSAIQVNGQRLYRLARAGRPVEAPLRQVEIQDLQVLAWRPGDYPELELQIDCGPGTYIRALARDLGTALGTGATLVALERTHSGGFDLNTSLTLEDLAEQVAAGRFQPLPADAPLSHLPAVYLDTQTSADFQHGRPVILAAPAPPGPLRLYQADDPSTFLGLAAIEDSPTHLRARVVLPQTGNA